ncbi:MAG: tetraacyldisaccharide 4'-kinase [Caulobacteraceae bacterium]
MSIPTPRWWYDRAPRRRGGAMRLFLAPVSMIWTWAGARRIARATPVDPAVPVICVGNLTLGGSGKTPVAREIVRLLTIRGVAPHVLTRGHGGNLAGPVRVDPARHTAAEVGDEALMLAADVPVWVARDRAAGARAAVSAGAEAIVMDDGHQNGGVRKALSLVVVDGETRDGEWPFGDGRVFPAGPLRELVAAGLARADAVIVLLPADLAAADPELLALFGTLPVLIARLAPTAPPPKGPQLAFAGVGKPWKVERALKAAGCDLADFAALADHAPLTEALLTRLAARAAALRAGLLTTEKDWVRLSTEWRARVTAWPVRAVFEDEAGAMAVIERAMGGRGTGAWRR